MKKQLHKRLTAVFLVFVVALALFPAQAYARTVTAKQFTSTPTVAEFKGSVKAIKRGVTTIKFKKGSTDSYVKFTAPKTKTYTFTFYSPKTSSSGSSVVVSLLRNLSGNTLKNKKLKTNEGWRVYFPVYDYKTVKQLKANGNTTVKYKGVKYKYLSKRWVKIKLTKGQTIYLDTAGDASGSVKVKIA